MKDTDLNINNSIVIGDSPSYYDNSNTEGSIRFKTVGGVKKFYLLNGPTNEEYTLYTSQSTWESKTHFENWTKSEAFRKAHSGGGQHKGIYLGPPQFEGFEVIL